MTILTPDLKPIRTEGMCACAVHCSNSPYHEKACCSETWCTCWCHAEEYKKKMLAKQADCKHSTIQGDNYGQTCLECGKVLAGFGFWAEGGSKDCVHEFLPNGFGGEICPYCETTKPK